MFKFMALNCATNMAIVISNGLEKLEGGAQAIQGDGSNLGMIVAGTIGVFGGIACIFSAKFGQKVITGVLIGVVIIALFAGGFAQNIFDYFQ